MIDPESYNPPLLEGETDAEWRLRQHKDPDHPFTLGDHSLAEVEEAVANGWPEARSENPPPPPPEVEIRPTETD